MKIVSTATFLLVNVLARVVAHSLAQVQKLVLVANAVACRGWLGQSWPESLIGLSECYFN